MAILLGSSPIKKISLGTTLVKKVSLGEELLWEDIIREEDTFTRANSIDIGTAIWTKTGNTGLGISNNRLAVSGTSTSPSRRGAIRNTASATPYQTVTITLGTAPNTTAVSGHVLRCNAAMDQMFIVSIASTQWSIGRITGINGTYTNLLTVPATISSGAVIRVECDTNSIFRAWINGVRSGPAVQDTTWADSSHLNYGCFLQRSGTTNSPELDDFSGGDTASLSQQVFDLFDRASIGPDWPLYGGGSIYLVGNEMCGVGLPSEPISFAFNSKPLTQERQIAAAPIQWHGRNPEHSSISVCVRANPASNHAGAHFWATANVMGLAMYDWAGTGFTAATGTENFVSTTKFPEGAIMSIEASGDRYEGVAAGVLKIQGSFSNAQVPYSNRYVGVHMEDDSAVTTPVPGGDPPANYSEFRAYVPLPIAA